MKNTPQTAEKTEKRIDELERERGKDQEISWDKSVDIQSCPQSVEPS